MRLFCSITVAYPVDAADDVQIGGLDGFDATLLRSAHARWVAVCHYSWKCALCGSPVKAMVRSSQPVHISSAILASAREGLLWICATQNARLGSLHIYIALERRRFCQFLKHFRNGKTRDSDFRLNAVNVVLEPPGRKGQNKCPTLLLKPGRWL